MKGSVMGQASIKRYDFGLRRRETSAMILLCLLSASAMAASSLQRNCWLGSNAPIETSRVESASEKINPNTATFASLRRLPQIGEVKARAIITYRSSRREPAFTSLSDLDNVRGIGPGILSQISPHLELPSDGVDGGKP